MKKILAFLSLFSIASAISMPVFGQSAVCFRKAKTVRPGAQAANAAVQARGRQKDIPTADYAVFKMIRSVPLAGGLGNSVEWTMASEKGNLGFYVYRSDENGRKLVDETMTIGSAGIVRDESLYDRKYAIVDPSGTRSSSYVVEAVGPFGERLASNPIEVDDAVADMPSITRDITAGDLETISPLPREADARQDLERANLTVHRWVVGQPGAKISVRAEGLYRVYLSNLNTAAPGIFNAGNSGNWRLFRDGIEQAILVGTNGSGPYLDFYGFPMDTRESDTRIYYLIADATAPGLRMARMKTGTSTATSTSYTAIAEKRERNSYVGGLVNGDAENWWGRAVTASSTNLTISLSGVDTTAETCTVDVRLQGWSLSGTPPSVAVSLNGTPLGTVSSQDFQVPFAAQFTVPASVIHDGNNTLSLASNVGANTELFDRVSISYSRRYVATANKISFAAPLGRTADVSGFSSANIRAFNINDLDRPSLVGNVAVSQNGAFFTATVPSFARRSGQRAYAVEESGLLTPFALTANAPSNLSSSVRDADMIIITHSPQNFVSVADAWANLRRGQGLNVEVVKVDDIFDEYSYGSDSVLAVKKFLEYAHENWPAADPQHQYVLLLGDASNDPRNYQGWGYFDLVPTMTFGAPFGGETSTDELLVDFDGDTVGEMPIGRIPFRTAAEIATAFNKTAAWEASPVSRDVNRGFVFAYDRPIGYDFLSDSYALANELPPKVPKTYVGIGLNNTMDLDPDRHINLINAINTGAYLVNFSGHGAQSFWGRGDFLSNASTVDINSANQSLFMSLTCLVGFFTGHGNQVTPDDECITEQFLKRQGGGPVGWGSSAPTVADAQNMMGKRFLNNLGNGSFSRIGDLVKDSKTAIPFSEDVRLSWHLFGDPSLRIH
jgi:hypothetical protein